MTFTSFATKLELGWEKHLCARRIPALIRRSARPSAVGGACDRFHFCGVRTQPNARGGGEESGGRTEGRTIELVDRGSGEIRTLVQFTPICVTYVHMEGSKGRNAQEKDLVLVNVL